MQNCEACKSQFQWKDILFSIWKSYKPIECSQCGRKHTITFGSKYLVIFLIIIPSVIFGLIISPNLGLSKPVTFGIIVVLAFLISLILPFFVKYESKKKRKVN